MKLKRDKLLSNFAFNFNLRPSTLGGMPAEGGGLSKAQLEGLPLDRRVHALFARGQRTVLRFSRIMHFAPAGADPEDVIAALLTVGRCRLTPGFCS